ncbi:MAG: translocase [Myxococcota bacterium]|nr:translocase [Myxococcota bacterium]
MSKLVDRVTSVFSRVRPGEGLPVVILLVDLFLILMAYYLLKVAREPLILVGGGGAEVKSYASGGMALILIVLVPAYGLIASRVKRMTLVNGVTALFAASFVVFWILYQARIPVGVPFYLWLGIFNMMVIAQFWSLANELFSEEQGKRLFPVIAIGGTIGAIAGSYSAGRMSAALGPGPLIPIAAGLLFASIALTLIGTRAARAIPRTEEDAHEIDDTPLSKEGGFKLVLTVKYLRMIAIMIVVYNIVNTMGEYILGSAVEQAAKLEAAGNEKVAEKIIGAFYGDFFTWVNIVAAVLQMFIVSRVVQFIGVRAALLILPAIALGGYGLIATVPIIAWMKVAKITENGVDYSLHNTVRQMLWLPTTREAKYKAKAAVDTFFVRFGDVLAAGLVWIGTTSLALSPRLFASVNVVMAAVWMLLAFLVGREYMRCKRQPTTAPATGGKPVRGKLGHAGA